MGVQVILIPTEVVAHSLPFPFPIQCFIPIPVGFPWDSRSHWESHSHVHYTEHHHAQDLHHLIVHHLVQNLVYPVHLYHCACHSRLRCSHLSAHWRVHVEANDPPDASSDAELLARDSAISVITSRRIGHLGVFGSLWRFCRGKRLVKLPFTDTDPCFHSSIRG